MIQLQFHAALIFYGKKIGVIVFKIAFKLLSYQDFYGLFRPHCLVTMTTARPLDFQILEGCSLL